MARKHNKRFRKASTVTETVLVPAITSNEREVVETLPGTPGAIEIEQEGGTVKFFLVRQKVVTPAVVKRTADSPTTTKGKRNHQHKGGRNGK